MGSDEFGGHIFIFAGVNQPKNKETVVARFSNVELFHVGQSFRKGELSHEIHYLACFSNCQNTFFFV
jgi:hypothetical protein